jgi:uncharacterized protein
VKALACLAVAVLLGACAAKPAAPAASSAGPSPSAVGSFDCAKPANAVQQMICTDPQLKQLEQRMHTAFAQALSSSGRGPAELKGEQTSWATSRDSCAQNPDVRGCVLESYQTRLVQLAIADPTTVAPPVVNYNCPGDFGPLSAQYYNQLDPPSAVFDWKGTQEILFARPSGSGARYGRQDFQYWEHQGQIDVDFDGIKFLCSTA